MRNLALVWVLAGCLLGCGGWKPSDTTFTDKRDGKVYKIVKIGSQTWFAENLNYVAEGSKCYGEGGKVEVKVQNFVITKTLSNTEVQANCDKYGRLYNWKTALTACPAGTHLPTAKEWATLVDYVGGGETAGTKLKSSTGWKSFNDVPAGTDEYGFSALPGGCGHSDGDFSASDYGYWWSATEDVADNYGDSWVGVNIRGMGYSHESVDGYLDEKTKLFSIRCVVDDRKETRK